MDKERRISTGIDGLDQAIDFLRPGDTVVWQCEHISDYMYVATRFVTNIARQGKRIAYIRFADTKRSWTQPRSARAAQMCRSTGSIREWASRPSQCRFTE